MGSPAGRTRGSLRRLLRTWSRTSSSPLIVCSLVPELAHACGDLALIQVKAACVSLQAAGCIDNNTDRRDLRPCSVVSAPGSLSVRLCIPTEHSVSSDQTGNNTLMCMTNLVRKIAPRQSFWKSDAYQ